MDSIDIGRRLPAFPVTPPCVRVTYTAVRRVELPMKPKAGRSAPERRPARFGPSGQSLGASPLLAAREARHYWRFCRHPLRRHMDLLAPLTVWAFLPRRRVSTMPAADFCPGVRRPHDLLSPEAGDAGQISRGKLDRPPRTTAGFTLCTLDGYGLRGSTPARPALTPRIRFLFIGSRVCSPLPSDPASRRRPCGSLPLHLHQVGERTYTSKLSNMLGTRRYPRAHARGTGDPNPKSSWRVS